MPLASNNILLQLRQFCAIVKPRAIVIALFFLTSAEQLNASELAQPHIGGSIQLDASFVQDDKAELVPGSGTQVRRARLSVAGVHDEVWKYKLRVGYEEDELSIKDAYLQQLNYGIKMGLFKPSFSLEEMTSSKFITFMERSLPNAFKPGRRIGVAYQKYNHNININLGAFGQGSDAGNEGDEGFGMSARLTGLAVNREALKLHLGFNLSLEQPQDDINKSLSFDARPESHITGKIVDTGDITDLENITRAGIEFVSIMQSVSVQGEAIQVYLNRDGANENLKFSGAYLYASWFLSGEQRPYKNNRGALGRIKPLSAEGAWEAALRFSYIDLNDADINGGKARNITLGINWYLSEKIRFMFNYIRVTTSSENAFGNPNIIALRAQTDF